VNWWRRIQNSRIAVLLALALVWTVLNALKPVHLDDAYFLNIAHEVGQHPADPYGFQNFWYQWPEPAFWLMCPMVLPYWLALPTQWFWTNPFVMKLFMFPFAFAFIWSVDALLRRFVARHVTLLLVVIVFSPAFFPSLNTMLDVPAMGLALLGLEWFMRSVERRSIALSLLAGVIVGLAMQTKYSVLAMPLVMLCYGVLHRRWGLAITACIAAGAVFWGWEAWLWHKYGESHFLSQFLMDDAFSYQPKGKTLIRLPAYVAGGLPILLFLAAAVLRFSRQLMLLLLLGFPICYLFLIDETGSRLVFTLATVLVLLAIGLLIARHKVPTFLTLWLAIEIGFTLASATFAAERRVMGIVIIATLMLAKFCFEGDAPHVPPQVLRWSAAVSIGLGLVVYATDLDEAFAWRNAMHEAVKLVREDHPNGRIYYSGHWGLDYYGPRAGATQLVPDNTVIHPGDSLLVFMGAWQPSYITLMSAFDARAIPVRFQLPWTLTESFYGGDAPIAWHKGDAQVRILLCLQEIVLPSTYADGPIIEIVERRGKYTPDAALPALMEAMRLSSGEQLLRARRALERVGPRGLRFALEHGDPSTRAWASERLRSLSSGPAPKS
jgi:hypothetical protein